MNRLRLIVAVLCGLSFGTVHAQEPPRGWTFGFELKGHYRDSDATRFPVPFPFGSGQLPVGETRGFLETVEAGEHAEISVVTLWAEGHFGERWSAKIKFDGIDRYDRNPTSGDNEYDLDELWIRAGRETEPGEIPDRPSGYTKIGKFPKFERQDDRHLESYGLASTSFNRFEDVGIELGFDLGKYLYFKSSWTQGNPVFIRDPNALAGDNGIAIFDGSVSNPDPELKSGLPILYETDVEDLDFADPEFSYALGGRFGSANGAATFDAMVWRSERKLADTVDLTGTFYGGDLDVVRGPGNRFAPPGLHDRDKSEQGINLWVYAGGFTLFGQYVESDLGGLERTAGELEISYEFELPLFTAVGGSQLFSYIAPAIRYSELDPKFKTNPVTPLPSIMWDWEKLDIGVRLGILDEIDATFEWNLNEFIRAGQPESHDEFLATVHVRLEWPR